MGSKKSGKVNPRRRPASQADVKRASAAALDKAIASAWAIFFTVLWDKEGFDQKRMKRVWDEVNALSNGINNEYVTVNDLLRMLEEEAGLVLT